MDLPNRLPDETPQSERRQATILFADISGFTSLSETTDSEIVAGLMNEIYAILGKTVEERGGVVCRFIGDCLMAVFGAPAAVEHAPRRALDAALEMRERLRDFAASRNLRASLDIHTGVNTGELVSGTIGSESKKEYAVYGDAVNVASRLKDAAPKGKIYVGSQTHRHTMEEYNYRKLEPLIFKGKSKPVDVYELTSRKSAEQEVRQRADRSIRSRMVGREKELELLENKVLKAIDGEGSIAFVSGEAGVGKSRLIAELQDKECLRRVTLLEGRAQSFGKNLSYHPIIDLLKKWATIREEDGETEAFRKLEEAIRSVSPEETDEVLPFVATLMGMRLTGKHAQRVEGIAADTLAKLIFKSARDLLSRAAQIKPLVIVLEDMHWADESTIEFVEYLFRMVEKDRVFFLIVSRQHEARGERLSKTAREGYGNRCLEVVLYPLDRQGCSELVGNLLKSGSLPSSMMESIVSRTGGNPFFVEEVIRACIDEQAVEVGREGFQVTEKISSFVVPATVNEVIMSRIDRLDKETRELLRVASVIGRRFFYKILVQVAQGVGHIDEKIGSLKEMQLILEQFRLEEVEYLFKHALAQQAIYDSILLQVRKSLHLSVARAIESIFAGRLGEFAGMLALHYTRAEDYDKAEEYMIRAGLEALKSAASSEALTYFRDALELYLKKRGRNADPAKVAMLEKNIARSLYYRGQDAEAVPYYERVQRYYGILVPKGKLATAFAVVLGLAKCVFWLYGPERRKLKPLTPQLREGLALTIEKIQMLLSIDPLAGATQAFIGLRQFLSYDLRDSEAGMMALIGISGVFSWSGISLAMSHRVLEKTCRFVSRERPRVWVFHLYVRTMYCLISGDWEERESFHEPLHDPLIERQLHKGNLTDILLMFFYRCYHSIERGDWDTLLEARQMIEEVSERFDNDQGRDSLNLVTVRYYLKRRIGEEALIAIARYLKFLDGSGLWLGGIPYWAYTLSSRVALLRGDFEGAVAERERDPNNLRKPTGSVMQNGMIYMANAAIALEQTRRAVEEGRIHRATRRKCLAALQRYLRNSRKYAPDLTEALKFLGTCYWHLGSRRRAFSYWRQSVREGERLGAKVELAHTFTDAGLLLGDLEPGPEWRKRGEELYSELGIGRQ